MIAFDAHIDTVYPGDRSLWSFDPFTPKVENGRIWGRGTVDQKGGMASMVSAGRIIRALKLFGEFTIYFTGTVMEEDCDGLCWQYILREGVLGQPVARPVQERPSATSPLHLAVGRGQSLPRACREGEGGEGEFNDMQHTPKSPLDRGDLLTGTKPVATHPAAAPFTGAPQGDEDPHSPPFAKGRENVPPPLENGGQGGILDTTGGTAADTLRQNGENPSSPPISKGGKDDSLPLAKRTEKGFKVSNETNSETGSTLPPGEGRGVKGSKAGVLPDAPDSPVSRRIELVVITEPTNLNIYRGHRGRMEIMVKAGGRSCHGSAPERGDNAIYKISRIALEIEKLNSRLADHPFLGKGTVTVTQVFFSSPSQCAVPDGASIQLDRRLTLGETKDSAVAEVKDACKLAGYPEAEVNVLKYGEMAYTGLKYPTEKYYPTWLLAEDSPHLSVAKDAYRALFRKEPEIGKWTFSTNGVAVMGTFGIPCIGFGPGNEVHAHAPNESCPVTDLTAAAAFYAGLVVRLNENL